MDAPETVQEAKGEWNKKKLVAHQGRPIVGGISGTTIERVEDRSAQGEGMKKK